MSVYSVCTFYIIPQTINGSRGEHISHKGLIIDLTENGSLWETEIMQHSVAVEYFDEATADQRRRRPTKVKT